MRTEILEKFNLTRVQSILQKVSMYKSSRKVNMKVEYVQ